MKFTTNHSILFALIFFQVISSVQPQILNNVSHVLDGITEQKPPPPSNQPSASPQSPQTSSSPATSPPSPPSPVQTTNPPPVASSSPQAIISSPPVQNSPDYTTPAPATTNPPTTSSTIDKNTHATPTSTSTQGGGRPRNNKATTATDTADDNTPSIVNGIEATSAKKNDNNSSGNKTGVIIGAVVGSIFGVALIGGLLTWINRHGGCARRSNKRSTDFEDYGLADTDFPQQHLQSSAMQTVSTGNSPAIGGAIAPTIPRLNDQGTFYNNGVSEDLYSSQHQYTTGYAAPMDHSPAMMEYSNGQAMMDYNQQQQPYYYQQPQDTPMGGYYDESSYYNNQAVAGHGSNPGYDTRYDQQAYVDHNSYHTTNIGGDHYYKPDQIELNPHHQRM